MLKFGKGFYWRPKSFQYTQSKAGEYYLVSMSSPLRFRHRGEIVTTSLSYAARRSGPMHTFLCKCMGNEDLVLQVRDENPILVPQAFPGEAKVDARIHVVTRTKADAYNESLQSAYTYATTVLIQILSGMEPEGFEVANGRVRYGGRGKWKALEEVNLSWVRRKMT